MSYRRGRLEKEMTAEQRQENEKRHKEAGRILAFAQLQELLPAGSCIVPGEESNRPIRLEKLEGGGTASKRGREKDFPQKDKKEAPDTVKIDLSKLGNTLSGDLLLRKEVPSRITLMGPTDLVFDLAAFKLTGQEYERNLAHPSRSQGGQRGNVIEFSFEEPGYVDSLDFGFYWPDIGKHKNVDFIAIGYLKNLEVVSVPLVCERAEVEQRYGGTTPIFVYSCKNAAVRVQVDRIVLQQGSIRLRPSFDPPPLPVDLLALCYVHSSSEASSLALGIQGNPALQIFQPKLKPSIFVLSRPLANELNTVWQRYVELYPEKNRVSLNFELLSQSDGQLHYDIELRGQRRGEGVVSSGAGAVELSEITFNGWQDAAFSIKPPATPFKNAEQAKLWLELDGHLEGSHRLGLMDKAACSSYFHAYLNEHMEIGQLFRIFSENTSSGARQLTAVWLSFPQVPKEKEEIEIQLRGVKDNRPGDEVLGSFKVTVPVDASRFICLGHLPGFWFKAVASEPVSINSSHAGRVLSLVLASQQTALLHATAPALCKADSIATGTLGSVFLKYYDDQQWKGRRFSNTKTHLLCDIELTSLPGERQIVINKSALHIKEGQSSHSWSGSAKNGFDVCITSRAAGAFKVKGGYEEKLPG